MAAELHKLLNDQLDSNERIHWTGQPIPERHYADSAKSCYGFGAVWCILVSFFTVVSMIGRNWFFVVFMIPFWAIGIYILWAPSKARRRASRTLYAITDRRALILIHGRNLEIRSFFLDKLDGYEVQASADGTGNLILRYDIFEDSEGQNRRASGFFGVPNIREPESILRDLRSRALNGEEL